MEIIRQNIIIRLNSFVAFDFMMSALEGELSELLIQKIADDTGLGCIKELRIVDVNWKEHDVDVEVILEDGS
jgi:hypothetical protein